MRTSTSVAPSHRTLPTAHRWLIAALLLCGILAPLAFLPFLIWAATVTPGYSHVSSTFSDAAAQGQPRPDIMEVGLLVLAMLLALFAIGCLLVFPRYERFVCLLVLVTAFAIGGTGLFQDYARGAPRNVEGFLHNAFAVVAIGGASLAILVSGFAARGRPGWTHLFGPSLVFALASILCGYLFETVSDRYDGLAERGFAVVALGWIAIVAITGIATLDLPMPRTSRRSPHPLAPSINQPPRSADTPRHDEPRSGIAGTGLH